MVSLALLLVLSSALSAIAFAAIGPMFSALSASSEVLPLIHEYMRIIYLGFPLLMLGIVGSGAIRAIGVTKQTEIIFTIAGIINLVFDWLLIFGKGPFPELGLAGAAWATALSFLFIFIGVTAILIRHGLIGLSGLSGALNGLAEILRFSVSTISMQILVPATGMFMTFLLAGYGSEAVAAFGIASRIEALALIGSLEFPCRLRPSSLRTSALESMTGSTRPSFFPARPRSIWG